MKKSHTGKEWIHTKIYYNRNLIINDAGRMKFDGFRLHIGLL